MFLTGLCFYFHVVVNHLKEDKNVATGHPASFKSSYFSISDILIPLSSRLPTLKNKICVTVFAYMVDNLRLN